MKKKHIGCISNNHILIEFLQNKNTVRLEMNKIGCKFLIDELTDFYNSNDDSFVDYDPDTGYSCGVLTKNSLGIMIEVNNKI